MDALTDRLSQLLQGIDWGLMIQVFVIVLVTLVIDFTQKRVLGRLHDRWVNKTENRWDDAILAAAAVPISLLIWIVGIAYAASVIAAQSGAGIFTGIAPAVTVAVIADITWFALRLTSQAERVLVESGGENRWDAGTVDALGKLVRAAAVITALLIAVQSLGLEISAILAFGGIGGIVIGFAARDLLANFFGGLTIYLDRPFKVGDWVRSPDRNIEGTVEKIGWRLTQIRTFDKRPLYVPNAVFTSIAIENPQQMLNRRIYETIGIRYDDLAKMELITNEVRQMLQSHPGIDADQTLMVYFDAFGPSSVDFFVYTFTKTTQWSEFHKVKHDVLLRIAGVIERHGAEIAFPTQTLHVPAGVKVRSAAG